MEANLTDISNYNGEREWTTLKSVVIILYILTDILILSVNPICLVVIQRVSNLQPTTKIFMSCLALSDTAMGGLVILPYTLYVYVGYWSFGVFLCTVFRIAKYLLFCMSFLSLLLLTIERYIAIAWCLHYGRLVTVRKSKMAVAGVFCSVTMVSVLGNVFADFKSSDALHCDSEEEQEIIVFVIMAIMLLGLLGILILYLHILIIARRQARRIAQETQRTDPAFANGAPQRIGTKSFTTVLAIAAIVVVGWIPMIACLFLVYIGTNIPPDTRHLVYVLYYTTAWMDAVVFYMRNSEIRRTLHKMAAAARGALVRKCKPDRS